jgi:hypothetical protein
MRELYELEKIYSYDENVLYSIKKWYSVVLDVVGPEAAENYYKLFSEKETYDTIKKYKTQGGLIVYHISRAIFHEYKFDKNYKSFANKLLKFFDKPKIVKISEKYEERFSEKIFYWVLRPILENERNKSTILKSNKFKKIFYSIVIPFIETKAISKSEKIADIFLKDENYKILKMYFDEEKILREILYNLGVHSSDMNYKLFLNVLSEPYTKKVLSENKDCFNNIITLAFLTGNLKEFKKFLEFYKKHSNPDLKL